MIDLTKPIRLKDDDGEAEYWGVTPDGAHVISYKHNGDERAWTAEAFEDDEIGRKFENTPPEPEATRLYVWWHNGAVNIANTNPEDAKRWRANGWKVSEHLVTEPQP